MQCRPEWQPQPLQRQLGPAAIPIAALAITAAGTGFAVYQAKQAQNAAHMKPEDETIPLQQSNAEMSTEQQAANLRAQTAAGTILSNPNDNRRQIGTQPNSPMKSLLGQ